MDQSHEAEWRLCTTGTKSISLCAGQSSGLSFYGGKKERRGSEQVRLQGRELRESKVFYKQEKLSYSTRL